MSLLGLVPALFVASLVILGPVLLSLLLVGRYGTETRGRNLRHLEGAEGSTDGGG